jgi:predicted metal-binding membrane protein
MGIIDRVVRILLAIAIVVLFLMDVISGTFGIILLVVAGIFVFTSFTRVCLLYLPFKINTARKIKE